MTAQLLKRIREEIRVFLARGADRADGRDGFGTQTATNTVELIFHAAAEPQPCVRSLKMLVLSRKAGQQIHIGDNITLEVRRVAGNRVTLAVQAPREVRILRGELKQAATEFEVDEPLPETISFLLPGAVAASA